MLRAEELMVGDYLTFRDALKDNNLVTVKVVAVNGATNELLASIDGDPTLDRIDIDDELCGIPISPEVLEKNGFKEKNIFAETLGYEIFGDEENSCGLSGWYDGSWEFDMFTPWTETADDGSPEDWGFGTETRITRIKYVHELQHCLKLCGIDKTIEL